MSFAARQHLLTLHSDFAKSYDAEGWQQKLLGKITAFIQLNLLLIDPSLSGPSGKRLLDYACGPGTITNALQACTAEAIGIDLSENMVEVYNTRFSGKDHFDAHAVVGNLLDTDTPETLSDSEYQNFDLAAVGLGFHHFKNVELAAQRLAGRLKSGGVLFIVDFLSHDTDFDGPAKHTIAHHGFDENKIKEVFEAAGLVDFGFMKMDEQVLIREHARTAFLARGRKQ